VDSIAGAMLGAIACGTTFWFIERCWSASADRM
jgi:hypothetical protein